MQLISIEDRLRQGANQNLSSELDNATKQLRGIIDELKDWQHDELQADLHKVLDELIESLEGSLQDKRVQDQIDGFISAVFRHGCRGAASK